MDIKISESWKGVLKEEFEKDYFIRLVEFVKNEYLTTRIYPHEKDLFRAFDKCLFDDIKVVIIGQDPYPGEGQANGLCFSVDNGVSIPPSLRNILKEVSDDTGAPSPANGNLDRWAEQGVLLLNAVLTVRAHKALSHTGMGWEQFTDAVVRAVSERKKGVVYMLWGEYAKLKGAFIDQENNCILKSSHPSNYSARKGFMGCAHFSQANDYLSQRGETPIVW